MTLLRVAVVAAIVAAIVGIARVPSRSAGVAWALGDGATAVREVAVLTPIPDDPVIVEAVSRMRSELGVIGVASHLVGCTDDTAADARACDQAQVRVSRAADGRLLPEPGVTPAATAPSTAGAAAAVRARRAPAVLISLARENAVVTIEVLERLPNGSRFFRLVYVPVRDGGKDPAVLAVRSVELLRDLHMEVERADALPPPVMRAVVATAPEIPPEPEDRRGSDPEPERDSDRSPDRPRPSDESGGARWRVSLALAGLWGRNGLGSGVQNVVPALGGAWMARPAVAVFLVASGPFSQDLHAERGTASSRQELAFAGARAEGKWRRLRPFAGAGLGVLHVLAKGTSSLGGAQLLSASVWAPTLTAGAGVALRVGRSLDIVAQVDTLWSAPSARITIGDEQVGRAGAPSVFGQLGFWLALP